MPKLKNAGMQIGYLCIYYDYTIQNNLILSFPMNVLH